MRMLSLVFALAIASAAPGVATALRVQRVCPECSSLHPSDSTRELTVRRARSASRAGAWNEAAELWRDALLMDGHDGAEWMALGEVLSRAERHVEAVAAYERAIQIDASLSRSASYEVARAYARMDDDRQTVRWLEQALRYGVSPADLWSDEMFERYRNEPRLRTEQKRQVDQRAPRNVGGRRSA
jgi:tetratricopeptide (TPR) repeat protein